MLHQRCIAYGASSAPCTAVATAADWPPFRSTREWLAAQPLAKLKLEFDEQGYVAVPDVVGAASRRRDCHSADALSPSLLMHLLQGWRDRER